jgi:hypothetical protein
MVNEMDKYSLNRIRDMADCPSTPEGEDTDGAKFLRECLADAMDMENSYDDINEDTIMEVADGLVPIYTNQLWNVWVDCGGYNHDGQFRDFVSSSEVAVDMNRIAQSDCFEWAYNILNSYVQRRG